MQTRIRVFAGTLLVGLAGASVSLAADPVRLNIKPGLWEIANESQFAGMLPIPDAELARLTPDQRARFEAMVQASRAEAAKRHLAKNCLTPEKIARGMTLDGTEHPGCVRKVEINSGSELQMSETCQRDDATTVTSLHFRSAGPESVSGTAHTVSTKAGKSMTVDATMQGKWLGASCGDVKDFQIEK